MLMGDTADNIPGLEKQPGKTGAFKTCGEACAEARLVETKNAADAYEVVKGLYQAYYGASWPDRFVEQAALLWMRTGNKAEVDDFTKTLPFIESGVAQAIERLKRRLR
jgi:DNA polymerase-1